MTIAQGRKPQIQPQPEDLIKEARRRQRRRYAVVSLVVGSLVGAVAGASEELGGGRSGRPGPPAHHQAAVPAPVKVATVPLLVSGTDTSLLMWPVGPAYFSADGPTAYYEDLGTGRVRESGQPAISAGDYQPLLAAAGRWLVYVGNGPLPSATACAAGPGSSRSPSSLPRRRIRAGCGSSAGSGPELRRGSGRGRSP